ncbi:MAG: cadherin-like domain-containing protein, partial [Verrucomicrobiales bacterium]|nr:cadherin-like domain-containing protein [Verrucomicrobiales bacterium]
GLPHWFFHHMALGQTIGFSARVTQNWGGKLYVDEVNDEAGQVHIALMGDPTLRMHPVGPVANLAGIRGNQSVALEWTASSDTVLGYHVYRATSSSGPFTRLTSLPLTETTFTDGTPLPGANTYMVRAVKLEVSPSGSHYNLSQGVFVTVEDAVMPPRLEISPIDDLIIDEDVTSAVLPFAINPPEIPADSLLVTVESLNPALIPESNIVLGGSGRQRSLTIRPALNQSGTAELTLTVSDGKEPVFESFQVTVRPVNDAPSAANDDVSTTEGVALTLAAAQLLANDNDPDAGDALTLQGVDPASERGGTLIWDDPIIRYNPPAGFYGPDSFNYTIGDVAGATAAGHVNVQVKRSSRSASIEYANGQLTLRLKGLPGEAYVIRTATDLQNWSALESGIVGLDGLVERSLSTRTSQTLCFYQVLWR